MKKILYFLLSLLVWTGCANTANTNTYTQQTMDQAIQYMETNNDYALVDVRTPDEYNSGHIPNAINLPNETILETAEKTLPDKDQTILVYCRTGTRSKQAAQKLTDLGYTNIIEIGGINNYTGTLTTNTKS